MLKTKTIAGIAVICCIISGNAYAFDDVPVGSEYYRQIEALSKSGIINGYEDNTFMPDNSITRSEFSKILCEAFDITETSGRTFSDVAASHWASQYIDALSTAGIINGFEDGTFKPDDHLTMSQAVKMVVCVKGHGDIAEDNGGYPSGYMSAAGAYGYMNNIESDYNSDITRGQCAALLYNAINDSVYELTDRVYGDYYNGYVHMGYYPEGWQGIPDIPTESNEVKANVYQNRLPEEMRITTNGVDYHTSIKTDMVGTTWYDLPEDRPDITNYTYDLECGAFVAFSNDSKLETIAYSYDLKTWYDGAPERTPYDAATEVPNTLPFTDNNDVGYMSDKTTGVAISYRISETLHADPQYYNVDLTTNKIDEIYISRDSLNWTYVSLPDNAFFATRLYVNSDGKSYVVSCAVELTEEDEEYVEEQAQKAESQGMLYDRPSYKIENYMIPFEDII